MLLAKLTNIASARDNRRQTFISGRAGAFIFAALVGVLLLLIIAPFASAQTTTDATLRGLVKDPTGAIVRGAAVTIASKDRGDQRQVKTNDEGVYVFTSVEPGTYTLKVDASGFKTATTNLTLAPSETRGLDVSLEVGGASETVTVSADTTSLIKTETGERSETITAKQLDNLSLIGRSSLELLRILPGVVAPDPSDPSQAPDFTTFSGGANASANYTVNGIRGQNNNVSIDGSRVIDIGSNNGTVITANNDMVQEVTVKSSNFAAEYGSSGVQISATTKGGTKDFHGELYDYFRPNSLQAVDRSITSVGGAKPQTHFNYPGGNVGGPILLPFTHLNRNRDKLFFFVGFELQRQIRDPGAKLGTVPTQAERNGDFSQSISGRAGNVFCPPSTFQYNSCTPVPNANYTPYRNPIGAALLNLFPLPNFTGTGARAQYNYESAITAPENRNDLKMRFDYRISNKTSMYLRLARESESDDSPYGIWWGPSTFELPSHLVGTNLGRSAAVNVTSVLSPTTTNEVVFSASKLKLDYDFKDPSKVTKSALGISNLQLPFSQNQAPTPYAPLALISWDVGSQLWEPGNLPLFAFNDSYSVTETLAMVRNQHTLKFGGLVEKAGKVQDSNGTPEGQIEYEGINQARTTGNAFANLYTGQINGITQTTRVPTGNFRFWNIEGFAQDSWKVKPNLTLEYGARLSLFTNNTETTGLGVVFDPSAYVRGAGPYIGGDLNRPNGVLQARLGQIPNSVFSGNPGLKIAPRLNLAWDIFKDGSTVLRGGAGVFYNRVQGNYQYAILTAPPNEQSVSASSWGAPNNDITLNNLASFNPTTLAPGANCRTAGNCPGVATQDLNSNEIPRTFTTSLSFARRLPFQQVLEVAYVGTFGRHLPQTYGYNYVTQPILSGMVGNADMSNPLQRAAVGNNPAALAMLLPYPDYNSTNGGVRLGEFTGTSNYHSMQVTLNRQGRRLQYFLTYTYSKALGTTSVNETDGNSSPDPVDTRHRSYGVLPYDRTHIFNLSFNYNLPNGARGSFRNWLTRGVLNGWQMSGITTVQSGRPIRLKFTGAILGDNVLLSYFGYNAQAGGNTPSAAGIAPILLRNPLIGGNDINGQYLDLSAIQIPGFGQTGPFESPFYVRSPTTSNFDVTFFKNFKFTETKNLQVRAGFFNIFNQAFANPDLGDINLTLNTVCNKTVGPGIPNGTGLTTASMCDPTGGFSFGSTGGPSTNTVHDFGAIINKHGHRRVELALKFYF